MNRIHTLRYIISLFLCGLSVFTAAQNPFELDHRREGALIETTDERQSENPFDKQVAVSPAKTKEPVTAEEKNGTVDEIHKTTLKVESQASSSFKFWVMTISLVLLTLLFVLYNSLVVKAYRGFLNENFLKMIHRNEGRIVSIPYLLLYGLYFISAATFAYLLTDYFERYLFKEPLYQYLAILFFIFFSFLLKHFVLFLLSVVFPLSKEVRLYSFTIIVFNIILGISLLPFNLFIAFTAPTLAKGLLYLALGLILVFYVYRSIRALLIAGSSIAAHKFHFFMYLCTVEIAPVLLVLALLKEFGAS
jgi:Domain of unknown function (DUF4271)